MAYYLGKQTTAPATTAQGQAAKPVTPVSGAIPECIKHCDSDLATCLVDASTFEEKQACRTAAASCRTNCGEQVNAATPAVNVPSPATTTPTTTGATPTDQGGLVQPPAGPTVPLGVTCTDADCVAKHGAGWHCENGYCVPSPLNPWDLSPCPKGGGYIRPINGQCPGGYSSVKAPQTGEWWCCPGKITKKCQDDAECIKTHGAGWKCGSDGKCYAETCTKNENCKAGEECIDGKCKKTTPKCVPGTACTTANILSTCPGGTCKDGKCTCPEEPPELDHTCKEGKACVTPAQCGTGTCEGLNDPINPKLGYRSGICRCGTTGCPEGTGGTALEGCPCGTLYNTLTGTCATGYKFVKRKYTGDSKDWAKEIPYKTGAVGTCECEKWITPGGGDGDLGEYQYPTGMQELMTLLLGRGKELMGMPLGYSQQAQDALFGKGFENVRKQINPTREAVNKTLASQGMLGTGAAADQMGDLAWNSENSITDLARTLFVGNEEKKKADLLDYTQASQSILGGGMSYEQLLESINSGRRGEGNAALLMLLQLLSQLGG